MTEAIAERLIRDLANSISAVGLVIIATIGHDLFKVEETDWQSYAERLAALDWTLDGELWRGNVVSNDRKILSQQSLVRVASAKVRRAIGLPAKSDENEVAASSSLQLA